MTRLWHCFNCATDFEGPTAKCTGCGAENEGGRDIIAQRLVIHFDPPHPIIKGRGLGHHACNPEQKVASQGMRSTGYPGSVTCPMCKASEVWKEQQGLLDTPMAYRVPTAKPEPAIQNMTNEVTTNSTAAKDGE